MLEGMRSSATKLLRVFLKSRDTWKQNAAEKQRRLKTQAGKISDLTVSRDGWKAKAQRLQKQLRELEERQRSEFVGAVRSTPLAAATGANHGQGELIAPPFCPHHGVRASRSV